MYRKKGMERIQDSLLQDLERATTNLKNNPGNPGGWKLNRPPDSTISSVPAYSTARVAKQYSPQYYVQDEPLYQNDVSLKRSQSNASNEHDYASINGYSSPSVTSRSPMALAEFMKQTVNGGANHLVNGVSTATPEARRPVRQLSEAEQVNSLLKDLEHNLQMHSPPVGGSSRNTPVSSTGSGKPTKHVTIANGIASQPREVSPSSPKPQATHHSAQVQPVSEYNRNLVNIHAKQVKMDSSPVIQVPLPCGPTSNATRELDDLMASLSDFKLNQMKNQALKTSNLVSLGTVQVPSKGVPKLMAPKMTVNELDSMIGNLELDLNQQGISTLTKGDCNACDRTIAGKVVTAMGKTWHPEHFVCAKCPEQLGDKNYFERNGLAYCEDDYHRLYSPKCAHCNQAILDRCITALDKTWHQEHFFCNHCGKNFGDDGYHEKAGNAYCKEDFFKLFAPKCSGCSQPIVDNFVTALGGQWHQHCFVCKDCHSPFVDGEGFFDFEGHPYCETHFYDKRGTLCAVCRKGITGRCITAMNQKFHPEHFTCSFCLKQLNKGVFKKHNDKPYCHPCFEKLFA